jgi:purine-binding chemotaxis protein CheW
MAGLRQKNKGPIELDWERARERLTSVTAANDVRVDPLRVQRILEARAQALACAALQEIVSARLEVLHFALGREHFAIETRYVCEVLTPCPVTRLPGAPEPLRGVLNLRGEILPVFDLRWVGATTQPESLERQRMLVLGAADPELCVVADAVYEIASIETADVLPASHVNADNSYLQGVTKLAWSVLDGAGLLADRRLWVGWGDSSSREAQ